MSEAGGKEGLGVSETGSERGREMSEAGESEAVCE